MNKLSNEIGILLPKGASSSVDNIAKKIIDKYAKELANKIKNRLQ